MDYRWKTFPNYGYVIAKFTDIELKPVWDEVNSILEDFNSGSSRNYDLAGHLKKQYSLSKCKPHIEQLMLPYVRVYEDQFNYIKSLKFMNKDLPLALDEPWVNFQQKCEFNPPHDHSGVYSYALWLKIPYSIQDEKNVFPATRNSSAGCFNFHYTSSLGTSGVETIPADKEYENFAVIFPSCMMHSVNPFYTSDDYRISVSGNFKFMVD